MSCAKLFLLSAPETWIESEDSKKKDDRKPECLAVSPLLLFFGLAALPLHRRLQLAVLPVHRLRQGHCQLPGRMPTALTRNGWEAESWRGWWGWLGYLSAWSRNLPWTLPKVAYRDRCSTRRFTWVTLCTETMISQPKLVSGYCSVSYSHTDWEVLGKMIIRETVSWPAGLEAHRRDEKSRTPSSWDMLGFLISLKIFS